MTVPEAFLIVVDDVISLYSLAFPYSCNWYGYRTVAADLYLQAFPGGYPGIELLNLLRGIIESPEPQDGM